MRCFGTHGRVRPEQHYIVSRSKEIADFIDGVKSGKYIVLFAPRQTGKTTFFRYLDHFVHIVGANMFLEVQTGRGRIDLLIVHNQRKYIVETKIWEGVRYYQAGKKQLAAYMKSEAAAEGYYVVFEHRQNPEQRAETQKVEGMKIRSYVIPVMQKPPSSA